MTDEEDGKLEGLGFVIRDSVCTQRILNNIGSSDAYSWISPDPKQLAKTPQANVAPKEPELTPRPYEWYLEPGWIEKHIDDEDVSTGLVVMTIIVWVLTVIATAFCCMQSMKMRMAMRARMQGSM